MSCRYIIDSYVWIEYFRGTENGAKARRYIEEGEAATPTIVLAELADKYSREGWKYLEEDIAFINSATVTFDLTKEIALLSGKTNSHMKRRIKGWSMADSILYATAKIKNAQIVTGDEHFRGVNEAILIK